MRWDTSSMIWPGVTGCFRSFVSGIDQVLACVPAAFRHRSALFIQSPLVAFSASSVPSSLPPQWCPTVWKLCRVIALKILCNPTPEAHSKLASLAPSSTSSWYLVRFLLFAFFMCSSQGTVSTRMISWFVESDTMIVSARSRVEVILVGDFSCLPRSASCFQSVRGASLQLWGMCWSSARGGSCWC